MAEYLLLLSKARKTMKTVEQGRLFFLFSALLCCPPLFSSALDNDDGYAAISFEMTESHSAVIIVQTSEEYIEV